jgi:hypothetical protein
MHVLVPNVILRQDEQHQQLKENKINFVFVLNLKNSPAFFERSSLFLSSATASSKSAA